MQLLAADALNTANPDIRFLAKPGERPAGIYMWCVFAPGRAGGRHGAVHGERSLRPQYAGVNLYSRPNTEVGRKFNEALGAVAGRQDRPVVRAASVGLSPHAASRRSMISIRPTLPTIEVSVTIARTFEDLVRVISVRSAVYIGQQECPFEEEFDGNDLCATHLLGYVGHEPAGCMRIRFFADFAKIERLAIREEFRKTRTAFQLVRAGFRLCQKKGYTRIYGHSQKRLVNFWSRFGFRVMEGAKSFVFSDFDYVEIVADIERDPDCVAIGADPYVIIRPEGRWHVPGVLEQFRDPCGDAAVGGQALMGVDRKSVPIFRDAFTTPTLVLVDLAHRLSASRATVSRTAANCRSAGDLPQGAGLCAAPGHAGCFCAAHAAFAVSSGDACLSALDLRHRAGAFGHDFRTVAAFLLRQFGIRPDGGAQLRIWCWRACSAKPPAFPP